MIDERLDGGVIRLLIVTEKVDGQRFADVRASIEPFVSLSQVLQHRYSTALSSSSSPVVAPMVGAAPSVLLCSTQHLPSSGRPDPELETLKAHPAELQEQ